ncbi:MAG: crotonase/enoyl-CoA hydratase family protein [Pseudomonadota bacterium]
MGYASVKVSVDEAGVATLVLDRPAQRNALSAVMIAELTEIAERLGQDDAVRAIVLSGAGKVFCAGGDLTWMKAQIEADRATRIREGTKLARMLYALNTVPKPLIGKIHGGAFGGGVGLACICDVAIAARDARFGLTETRLGLIPATIAPYVIARLGEGVARRVIMASRVFDATEAMALGVIADAVDAASLDARIEQEVAPYLATAPGAVARTKALARALGPTIDDSVIAATIERLADAWDDPEALQGIEAFLGKTSPPWASRNSS